jgi:hypothetical protein
VGIGDLRFALRSWSRNPGTAGRHGTRRRCDRRRFRDARGCGATFGVGGVDPIAFVSAALLMLSVPAGAAFVAARRSARLEPMQALRVE